MAEEEALLWLSMSVNLRVWPESRGPAVMSRGCFLPVSVTSASYSGQCHWSYGHNAESLWGQSLTLNTVPSTHQVFQLLDTLNSQLSPGLYTETLPIKDRQFRAQLLLCTGPFLVACPRISFSNLARPLERPSRPLCPWEESGFSAHQGAMALCLLLLAQILQGECFPPGKQRLNIFLFMP